jgi:hypothetical protein
VDFSGVNWMWKIKGRYANSTRQAAKGCACWCVVIVRLGTAMHLLVQARCVCACACVSVSPCKKGSAASHHWEMKYHNPLRERELKGRRRQPADGFFPAGILIAHYGLSSSGVIGQGRSQADGRPQCVFNVLAFRRKGIKKSGGHPPLNDRLYRRIANTKQARQESPLVTSIACSDA